MTNRAVADGTLVYTSASAISTYQSCPLKYYFTYVLGFRAPATKGQGVGLIGHKEMDLWIKDRSRLPIQPSANLFAQEFTLTTDPSPEKCIIQEPPKKNLGLFVADVPIVGELDLFYGRGNSYYVWDWKFVKDLKYAKSEEDLIQDVQMSVYARYILERYPGAKNISINHVYFRTDPEKKPKYKVVSPPSFKPEDVLKNWDAFVVPPVYEIKDVCQVKDVKDVEATPSNCFKYGPCPFRFGCDAYRREHGRPWGEDPFGGKLNHLIGASILDQEVREQDIMSLDDLFNPQELNKMEDSVPKEQRVNPPDAAKSDPLPEKEWGSKPGLNLFIDCVIARYRLGDEETFTRNLEDIIEEYAAPICKVNNVKDVREIKFGEGKVALLRAFRDKPPSGNVIARTGGLSTDVLEVLLPMASLVVRG